MAAKVCFVLFGLLLLITTCYSLTLFCKNGIVDSKHNVCMLKAGYGNCSTRPFYKNCVPNSYCNRNQICTCKNGFYRTTDNRCVHGYEEACMTSWDCDSVDKALKCGPTGKCICPFPDQHYDKIAKRCLATYRGSCSALVECESNFVCKNKACTCPEGLDLSLSREKCSSGLDKICNKKEDCDSSRLLFCQEGHCKCQAPLKEYNHGLKMCVGQEGEPCTLKIRVIPKLGNYLDFICAEGTSCQGVSRGSDVGICKSYVDVDSHKRLVDFVFFFAGSTCILVIAVYLLVKLVRMEREEIKTLQYELNSYRDSSGLELERIVTSTPPPPPYPLSPAQHQQEQVAQ